jgi:hypothetical protein
MKGYICFLLHPQILSLFSFFLSSSWGTFTKHRRQVQTLNVDTSNLSDKLAWFFLA